MSKIKFCFVRELVLDEKPVKVEDGYARTLTVTDKDGNSIKVVFKGAKREHLLVDGLRDC